MAPINNRILSLNTYVVNVYLCTDLVDDLAQDKVSVLWATPLDGSHQQVTEAVDCVRQLI